MGLYDRVRCEYPLPDPEAEHLEYQTKSTFAPYLKDYIVTRDGRLLCKEGDEWEDEDSNPAVSAGAENCRWVPVDFRGELEIHTTVKQADESPRWYSYLLWFKDNRVADLQRGNSWGDAMPPYRPAQQT
jgi:hypothetical protein